MAFGTCMKILCFRKEQLSHSCLTEVAPYWARKNPVSDCAAPFEEEKHRAQRGRLRK